MPNRVSLTLEERTVFLRCWKYEVSGIGGFKVPVYFLDTDIPENSEWDRTLTHFLYLGDQRYRLCSNDAFYLYDKLEQDVIPLFYRDRDGFIDIMRHAIALNGSFFNTQRMLQQYVLKAYFA